MRRPHPRGSGVKRWWSLLFETFTRFESDGVPRLAAAISYFLLLAVAPLLLVVNAVVGVVGKRFAIGDTAAIENAGTAAASSFTQAVAWAGSYAPYVAFVLVVFGAVSVFGQFVASLEVIWDTPPRRTPVRAFLRYHLVSFALLGLSALVLLVALVVSGMIMLFAGVVLEYLRGAGITLSGVWISLALWVGPIALASFVMFWVAYTAVPDRRIAWRDTWLGALLTTVLFVVGEFVLGRYLSTTQRFNVFGTFQFFVALIVWIYYTALVALWGAELTRLMVLDAETVRGESPGLRSVDEPVGAEPR